MAKATGPAAKAGRSAAKPADPGAKAARSPRSPNPARRPTGVEKAAPPRARRESRAHRESRALEVLHRLQLEYPDAACSLDYRNPYELLVATILSAQCTDVRVNMTTPALFARFPDAAAMADATQEEVEELIRSTGFFRSKAKNLIAMARALVIRHRGGVPDRMDALKELPGVGRKTANVILGNAFHQNEGIVVDTHVTRLAQRLGFTSQDDAVKIEQDLMPLFPREQWTLLSHLLIDHGRAICDARTPKCAKCVLADICPASRV